MHHHSLDNKETSLPEVVVLGRGGSVVVAGMAWVVEVVARGIFTASVRPREEGS